MLFQNCFDRTFCESNENSNLNEKEIMNKLLIYNRNEFIPYQSESELMKDFLVIVKDIIMNNKRIKVINF